MKLSSSARHAEDRCHRLKTSALRLGEFDIGGVLYHANYFHLYEMAREALLAEGGSPYPQLVASGAHLAVIESSQRFKTPVLYGQSIEIRTVIQELSRVRVTFVYEIFDVQAAQHPLHSASTTHVYVKKSADGFRPAPFPDPLLTALKKYTGDV